MKQIIKITVVGTISCCFLFALFKNTSVERTLPLKRSHLSKHWYKSSTYFYGSLRNTIEFLSSCPVSVIPCISCVSFLFSSLCVCPWVRACMLTSVGTHCVCRCAHQSMCARMYMCGDPVLGLPRMFRSLFVETGSLTWAQSWLTALF